MKTKLLAIALGMSLLTCSCGANAQSSSVIDWNANTYPSIRQVFGQPEIFQTPLGMAVHFNGESDGAFLDEIPILGLDDFTIELIFRQDGDAKFEQRFLHIGTVRGPRILFETRVKPDSTWYFDAFINLGTREEAVALIDTAKVHPTDQWYNLTMTVSKDGIASYVNGIEQGRHPLSYRPVITEGFTSIGVRQNMVCWFKGDMFRLRITPKVLKPEEFLQDYKQLNGNMTQKSR